MSPAARRSWIRYAAVGASAVVMLPLLDVLSQHVVLKWLGVILLLAITVLLFRSRKSLRAAFFLPLIYLVGLAAIRLRVESGIESVGFTVAIVAFLLLCVIGLLADAFWSPYADDLAEMEHLSR